MRAETRIATRSDIEIHTVFILEEMNRESRYSNQFRIWGHRPSPFDISLKISENSDSNIA
jgi:hypothetical protein